MAYIEPAPIKDKGNPFESMMSRFRIAAEHLGLGGAAGNHGDVGRRGGVLKLSVGAAA